MHGRAKVVGLFWNIIKVKKLAMLVIVKVQSIPDTKNRLWVMLLYSFILKVRILIMCSEWWQ